MQARPTVGGCAVRFMHFRHSGRSAGARALEFDASGFSTRMYGYLVSRQCTIHIIIIIIIIIIKFKLL